MITQKELKKFLHYDPSTGIFTRAVARPNASLGSQAGTKNPKGYIMIGLNGKIYRAHRLAFLYMTGSFPEDEVDHINHIRDDNRWPNIRLATRKQNTMNRSLSSSSSSGFHGVNWVGKMNKWRVRVIDAGARRHLGYFSNLSDAVLCRVNAEVKGGYHLNHGNNQGLST